MGRELKRKQAKKEGKIIQEKKVEKNEDPYNDIYKLFKNFEIILLIVIAIHFITALVITKEIEWFSKDEEVEEKKYNVANTLLAKNALSQSEDEYYVYFYDYDKPSSSIDVLVKGKLVYDKVYNVNTKDGLNLNYTTEEEVGNISATTIDELKVISPTLIKVSNETIVEYYETEDGITNYLEAK